MKKANKLSIILILALLVVVAIYFILSPEDAPSESGRLFPGTDNVDEIHIIAPTKQMVFEKSADGKWSMTAPHPWAGDPLQFQKIDAILASGIQTDLSDDDSDVWEKLGIQENSRQIILKASGNTIGSFKLGSTLKMEGSNAERVWLLPEGSAFACRAFTPLYDIGKIFQAPEASWRNRLIQTIDEKSIISIEIHTALDVTVLQKDSGHVTSQNPEGWIISDAEFEVDPRAVASLTALVSPLYADGFADGVQWADVQGNYAGGFLTLTTAEGKFTLHVGREVSAQNCADCATAMAGERFVKWSGDDQHVYTMQPDRVVTLLPTPNALRDKRVLTLDAGKLTEISVETPTTNLKILPNANKIWQIHQDGKIIEPNPERLGWFVRLITQLDAGRFLEPHEKPDSQRPAAMTITLKTAESETILQISDQINPNVRFHYAILNENLTFIINDRIPQAFGALITQETESP